VSEALTVEFPGGHLSLTVDADFLTLSDDDLELILQLRRQMKNMGSVTQDALAPATNGFVPSNEEKKPVVAATNGGGSSAPKVKAVMATAGARRKFSDDDKAEAVREAEQEGYRATAVRLGVADTQIHRWKREGFGKRTAAMHGDNYNNDGAKAIAIDTPSGPAIRCPVCKTGVPVTDPGDVEVKRKAMGDHYKVSPDCLTVARKAKLA
jgi:hypothetical protein